VVVKQPITDVVKLMKPQMIVAELLNDVLELSESQATVTGLQIAPSPPQAMSSPL
jgi:hypothetical protein